MKKRFLLLLLLLAALGAGCADTIRGSGDILSQSYDFSDFVELEGTHGLQLEVTQGESYAVTVEYDDNLEDLLVVEQRGETVHIGLDPARALALQDITLRAQVIMPRLTGASLSGGSDADIAGFGSDEAFRGELSGGSTLRGDLAAGDTRFELSGGSRVELEGSGADLTVGASGGSEARLSDYAVNDASVDVSGGGTVEVNPSGELRGSASGGARVVYAGDPEAINVDTSGGSTVRAQQ